MFSPEFAVLLTAPCNKICFSVVGIAKRGNSAASIEKTTIKNGECHWKAKIAPSTMKTKSIEETTSPDRAPNKVSGINSVSAPSEMSGVPVIV